MAHLQQFPKSFSWTTLLALLSALFLLVHLPKHVASSSSDFSSGSNSSSGSPTVIRTEPSSSGSGFGGSYGSGGGGGNRLSSASSPAGHKYRSSFYYPKYKQRRASTTLATPSAAALTQGPAASSSAAGPVYVVWSRQNGGGAGAAADQEYGAASDTSAIASAAGTSGAVTSYQDLENYYHYDLHSPSMDTKFSEYYQSYPYHHGHGGYESAGYEEPPAAYVGKPKYMPDEDESSRESSGSRFRDEDEDVDRGRDGRKRGRDRDRDGRPEHRSERERGEYRRDRDRRNEDEYLDEEHDSYDEKPKASKKSSSKALAKHNKNRRTGFDHLRGGLLSLKGLKLSAIGFFYLFRGLLILLWKFLPWIFLVIVMFLFIPIPIITIPATAGRGVMASVNTTEITNTMTALARKVVDSEECVERISCEVRERSGRESWIPAAVKFLLYNYGPQLPPTVSRMAKAFVQNRPCKYVKCDMVSQALE